MPQETVIVCSNQRRKDRTAVLVDEIEAGKRPLDIVRMEKTSGRRFDQHATDLAVGMHMADGGKRDDPHPTFRRAVIPAIRPSPHKHAVDIGGAIGHRTLEPRYCRIPQPHNQLIGAH
jgi:hypothetical protein